MRNFLKQPSAIKDNKNDRMLTNGEALQKARGTDYCDPTEPNFWLKNENVIQRHPQNSSIIISLDISNSQVSGELVWNSDKLEGISLKTLKVANTALKAIKLNDASRLTHLDYQNTPHLNTLELKNIWHEELLSGVQGDPHLWNDQIDKGNIYDARVYPTTPKDEKKLLDHWGSKEKVVEKIKHMVNEAKQKLRRQ